MGLTTASPKASTWRQYVIVADPPEDDPGPSKVMMPHSTPKFQSLAEAIDFMWLRFSISAPERFDRYLLEARKSQLEAMAKYRWNAELSEALMPCLQAVELTLRNAIHQAMTQRYATGDPWWFDANTANGPLLSRRDWDKVQEAKDKIATRGRVVTMPRVVAELTFGFWVELLNPSYDKDIVRPLLGTTMRRLKTGERTQGWMRKTFGEFRDLRNRVVHHEAIYTNSDLHRLNHLAWQIVTEVDPWQAHVLRPTCRFDEVWSRSWVAGHAELNRTAQTLFNQYQAP